MSHLFNGHDLTTVAHISRRIAVMYLAISWRAVRQVWRSPTAAARASSSARHDAGAVTGRTTNFEKPTAMNCSMSFHKAGNPTGVSSSARGRRAVIMRAVAGSMGAPA